MNANILVVNKIITAVLGASVLLLIFPHITHASGWSYVEAFFYTIVVSIFGTLAGAGGVMLDYAINDMVLGFGDLYNNKGLGFTIDSLWVVVRDIFNLTFIFGLVFIGLRLIFDSSNSSARKTLVSLILAALLVNFSLFITKFVIDFSNIAAVQLIDSFPKVDGKAQISGSFVQIMGGQTVFSIDGIKETALHFDKFKDGAGFVLIMGTLIVFLVMTFVFMGGALLLMIRFVALNFYMLLSPLMFAGMVFPSAGRITQEFWSGFLGKAFFAPAYFLMLYFSHKILSTFQVTGGGSLAKAFTGADKAVWQAVLPPFVLGAIFLIASLIIAQKMGATGAGGVISAGKMLTGKAKRLVADKTVGYGVRGAAQFLNSKAVTRANARLNTTPGFTGALARAGVAGVTLGALSKRNRQAVIENSNNWSVGGSQSLSSLRKEDQNVRTADARVLAAAKTERAINTGMETAQELKQLRAKKTAGTATPAELARLDGVPGGPAGLEEIERNMISAIAGMAISDLEKISPSDWAKYAPHLTGSQVESVMKSDNIDQTSKNNIINARQAAITAIVGSTGGIITKELTKLTIDQIETMGDQWIKDNVHLFSSSQMEDLKKSKRFNDGQKTAFQTTRSSWHKTAATTGPITDRQKLFKNSDGSSRKPEDVASLGNDVFFTIDPISGLTIPNANVLPFITQDVLEKIAEKKTLGRSQRLDLKTAIMAHPTAGPRLSAYFATTHAANNWD
jgi:hypothetical protein